MYSLKDLAPVARSFFVTINAVGMATFAQKVVIMLSLSYLNTILFPSGTPDIDGVTSTKQVMEARAGMGGAVELIQSKNLPVAIVLEHAEEHTLMLADDGGFHQCVQSLWIMEQRRFNEEQADVMERCFARFKRLYTILLHHVKDAELQGWRENNEITAYDREAGDYVGYELFIHFREYNDLTYHALNE